MAPTTLPDTHVITTAKMKPRKKSALKEAIKVASIKANPPLPIVVEEPPIGDNIHVPTPVKQYSSNKNNRPIYEPDNYDMEQFRNGISLANSSSLDIETSSSDESSKASDDSSSVVDSTTNPTQLFLRINYRLWDMATSTIEENPSQASTWVVSKSLSGETKWKNLPIHNACEQSPPPPVSLVKALIQAYPKGVRKRNFEGNLPLHIACANKPLVSSGKEGEAIISALVESYPDSLTLTDEMGRLPMQILDDCGTTHSIKTKLNGEYKPDVMKPNESKESVSTSNIDELRSPPNPDRSIGMDLASELNRRSMKLPNIKDDSMRTKPDDEDMDISSLGSADSAFTPVMGKKENNSSNVSRNNLEETFSSNVEAILKPKKNLPPMKATTAPSSNNILGIEHSKAVREIILLRQQASRLTGENLTARTLLEEKALQIKRLQSAIDEERGSCRDKIRDLETKITTMNDNLASYEHKIKLKEKAEETLAQTISSLESNLAGRKAEASTIREALKTETSSKATIESELGATTRKVEQLCRELEMKHNDFEDLMRRYDDTCKETNTVKQAYITAERRIQETSHTISEKEVQLRAITESKSLSEKRIQKLEQIILSLRSKNTTLKDVVRKNNDSFTENTSKLEVSLHQHNKEKNALGEEIGKMLKRVEVRDGAIHTLKEEKKKLQAEVDSLRDKSSETSENTSRALSTLQKENERFKSEIESLTTSLNQSRQENEEKASNLMKLAEDADSVLDKLEKERKEVFELKKENCGLNERIDKVISENDANKSHVGKLKDENLELKNSLDAISDKNAENEKKIISDGKKLAETELRAKAAELQNEKLQQEHTKKIEQMTQDCNDFNQLINQVEDKNKEQLKEINELSKTKKLQGTQIKELEKSVSSLEGTNASLNDKLENLSKVEKRKDEEREKLRGRVSDLEKEKENLLSNNNKLLVETEKAVKATKLQNQQLRQDHMKRVDELTGECDQFKVTVKILEDKNKAQSKEINELGETKLSQATKIRALEDSVNSLQKDYIKKIQEMGEECNQLKATVQNLEDKNSKQSKEIDELNKTKLGQVTKISHLEESVSSLNEKNKSLRENYEALNHTLETSEKARKKLFEQISEYEGTLKRIEMERLQLSSECEELREARPNTKEDNVLQNPENAISSKSFLKRLKVLQGELHVLNDKTVTTVTSVPLRLCGIIKKIEGLKEGATLDKSASSFSVSDFIDRIEKTDEGPANNAALLETVSIEDITSLAEKVNDALETNEGLLSDLGLIQTDLKDLSFSVESKNSDFEELNTQFQNHLLALEKEIPSDDFTGIDKSISKRDEGKIYSTNLDEQLRADLEISKSKVREKEDLNKSFQKEVTRLLEDKALTEENIRHLKDSNSVKEAEIQVLERVKNNLLKQLSEGSNLIENMLFKLSSLSDDSANAIIDKTKDERDNRPNMECLLNNALLLEQRVSSMSKAHTLMASETENLRNDVDAKDEKIEALELVAKTLEIDLDGQRKLQKTSSDDKDELAKILEEYDSQNTSYGEAMGSFKESRAQRLAGLLERNCKEIMDLEEQVAKYDIKTSAYKTMIGQLQSTTEALKRDKVFLKAAAKEKEYKARQNEHKLQKENSTLKLIIGKLTNHTEQLRAKIGQLKDRQVALQENKALLLDDDTEEDLVFELWKLSATMSEDDDASDYFKELDTAPSSEKLTKDS